MQVTPKGMSIDHPDRRARPRNRRAVILAAAFEAFAHNGYHDTSMADIAEAVGITPAALYRHFSNKQHLLGQCVLTGLDDALARLDAASRSRNSRDAILAALVQVALERRGLPRLWQLEFRHLHERDRSAVLIRAARLTRHLHGTVRSRRPELSAADVECLSWCALSVAVSPAYHRLELPIPVAAQVLGAAMHAVIATDLPTQPTHPLRAHGHSRFADGTDLDRALRRERIIAGAARLFTQHGFPNVSIHDIGVTAGITGPGVYHYFDNKAELLDMIVRRHDEWIELLVAHAMTRSRSSHDAIATLTHNFVRFGADEPDLLAITVSETRHLPTAAEHRYRRVRQDGIASWARMLGAARPELAPPVTRMLIRAFTTVVIEAVRNPRLNRRTDLVELLVAIGHSIQSAPAGRKRPPRVIHST